MLIFPCPSSRVIGSIVIVFILLHHLPIQKSSGECILVECSCYIHHLINQFLYIFIAHLLLPLQTKNGGECRDHFGALIEGIWCWTATACTRHFCIKTTCFASPTCCWPHADDFLFKEAFILNFFNLIYSFYCFDLLF